MEYRLSRKSKSSNRKGGAIVTRKDYLLIASALRDVSQTVGESTHELIRAWHNGVLQAAEAIATRLEMDNPRFDRAHFLAVVRGEKELTSKPQSKPSCCISDGCGRSFDPNMEETRPHETLRPFWMRYCHRHRVTGKLYPAIVEKTC